MSNPLLDTLLGDLLSDSQLTPEQSERVQAAAAAAVAGLSVFDLMAAAGQLLSAKAAMDAGDEDRARELVEQLAERYGFTDLVHELAAEIGEAPALPPGSA